MSKWLAAVWITAIGCGGGSGGGGTSGLPDDARVGTLNAADGMQLCEYLVEALGPARTVTCGPDDTREVGGEDIGECLDSLNDFSACALTVAQYEGCVEAVGGASDAEVCAGTLPPACQPLLDCVPEDDGPPDPEQP
jgi:hypothetical protein